MNQREANNTIPDVLHERRHFIDGSIMWGGVHK